WNIPTILYPIPEEWIMKDFFLRCRRSPRTTLEASFRSIPVAAMPHQSVMARPSSLEATNSPGSHIRNYISTLVRRAGAYTYSNRLGLDSPTPKFFFLFIIAILSKRMHWMDSRALRRKDAFRGERPWGDTVFDPWISDRETVSKLRG
ncbi:hypothetical protein RYX36_012383, partial [Vicia faba]